MRTYTVHGRSSERYPESGCPAPRPPPARRREKSSHERQGGRTAHPWKNLNATAPREPRQKKEEFCNQHPRPGTAPALHPRCIGPGGETRTHDRAHLRIDMSILTSPRARAQVHKNASRSELAPHEDGFEEHREHNAEGTGEPVPGTGEIRARSERGEPIADDHTPHPPPGTHRQSSRPAHPHTDRPWTRHETIDRFPWASSPPGPGTSAEQELTGTPIFHQTTVRGHPVPMLRRPS
jgi:hypothetical protein